MSPVACAVRRRFNQKVWCRAGCRTTADVSTESDNSLYIQQTDRSECSQFCLIRDTIIMNYQQAKSPQKKFLKSSSSQSSVESSATAGREMAASRKSPTKEFSKPADIKLHTQDRALKRAMFNYAVATKLNQLQQRKKEEEKLQKILEEKEVRMLRKEMVPKAQLMPLFDRPFFPQRSNRPLTIPKEPSFYANIHGKYWNSNQFHHTFQPYHAMRPIK